MKRVYVLFSSWLPYLLLVAGAVLMALSLTGCKQEATACPEAPAAYDGKRLQKGCVWFYPVSEKRADRLAFCDDGRICVGQAGGGGDEWNCIQFRGTTGEKP